MASRYIALLLILAPAFVAADPDTQGGDDTFGTFPNDLRALVSHALPNVTVQAITYPKFETRGDLKECVSRLQEW